MGRESLVLTLIDRVTLQPTTYHQKSQFYTREVYSVLDRSSYGSGSSAVGRGLGPGPSLFNEVCVHVTYLLTSLSTLSDPVGT